MQGSTRDGVPAANSRQLVDANIEVRQWSVLYALCYVQNPEATVDAAVTIEALQAVGAVMSLQSGSAVMSLYSAGR